MRFWQKVRWWLTPLGINPVCELCGHETRYHHHADCYFPVGPLGTDCGCVYRQNMPPVYTGQLSGLSDHQEPTK